MKTEFKFFNWWPRRDDDDFFWQFRVVPGVDVIYDSYISGGYIRKRVLEINVAWLFWDFITRITFRKTIQKIINK